MNVLIPTTTNTKIKMKKTGKLFMAVLFILYLVVPPRVLSQTGEKITALPESQIAQIEAFVQKQMTNGKIPGMSVVIVKGDQTVYEKGFGFADIETKEPVTPATLFELGSCSKAFTGLAILQLEEKGLLKLSEPVGKYIPWLKMEHKGKEVHPTVAHFLYQTSGLRYFETLGNIPPSKEDDALEKAVRTLVGRELIFPPGQRFFYATMNYDVLGLIIQKVSGLSYEEYIKKSILIPLQLNNTFLFSEEAEAKGMATGYKLCFKKMSAYDAPVYRGNAPAAYIISNARDLAQWLKIQMSTVELPGTGINKELIEKSHVPDPGLAGNSYAAGWQVFSNYRLILHTGGNPNFSSFIGFGGEKVGVAVLGNTFSGFITGTGQGIMTILRGIEARPTLYDMNLRFDDIFFKIFLILSPLMLLALVLLIRSLIQIAGKKRQFSAKGTKRVVGFIVATVLIVALVYIITIIPTLLGFKLPLSSAVVWAPKTFAYGVLWIFLTGFLYYLFFLSLLFFPKRKK